MGLLKKIGKAVKKVFKGVKKVFKKVTKFVGRAMQSKWGKALMIAATIFTMGAAAGIWGGFGAASAAGATANAGGFFSKFVGAAKNIFGIGGQGAAAAAAPAVSAAEAAAIPGLAPLATTTAAAPTGIAGVMGKAANAAVNFLKTPGGGVLAGNVISGYAQGKQAEAELKEQERQARYYDNQWRDPAQLQQLQDAARTPITTPQGFMNRARRVDKYLDERASRFPVGAPNPEAVAGYAAGA